MPIQRPSQREHRPSALDVFTDREELIAAFERNLEHKKPDEHRVLVFYGDGGIGKTTLLQKLEQLHSQRCPQALMGRLDLAGADTTPPDLLLYRLRRLFPAIHLPLLLPRLGGIRSALSPGAGVRERSQGTAAGVRALCRCPRRLLGGVGKSERGRYGRHRHEGCRQSEMATFGMGAAACRALLAA